MSQSRPQSNSWQDKLKDFFQPDCPLPVEDTIEILRQQNMAVFSGSIEQGKKGITYLLDSYKHAIEAQSLELATLKSLETYIRRGTLTDEKLRELMDSLDKIRQSNMEKLAILQQEARDIAKGKGP